MLCMSGSIEGLNFGFPYADTVVTFLFTKDTAVCVCVWYVKVFDGVFCLLCWLLLCVYVYVDTVTQLTHTASNKAGRKQHQKP
jgi:hypothetical protein